MRARAGAGSPVTSARLDRTLAALADPHRRGVVDVLGRGPQSAGDLARKLGLTAPAMSRHLRVLREGGLVQDSHPHFDARVRVYSLRSEPMVELRQWLAKTEQLWADQLLAFKSHIEKDFET